MDINNMFSGGTKTSEIGKQRKISLVSYLNTKPLIYGLEENRIEHTFELQSDVPAVCADNLKSGTVDLGIIPSIEYAQGKGQWNIIPDLCISSQGPVTSVNLFFNKELRDLNKIAVDSSSRTSVALLKILMAEKYNLDAEYIVMKPDLDVMLAQADAALLIGDLALYEHGRRTAFLDLGEEWTDFTGLPFVYAFWSGIKSAVSSAEVAVIQESFRHGSDHLEEIAKTYAQKNKNGWERYYQYLTEQIYYQFGPQEQDGLREFYRYAFYFGLIEHIPDLHFYDEQIKKNTK